MQNFTTVFYCEGYPMFNEAGLEQIFLGVGFEHLENDDA